MSIHVLSAVLKHSRAKLAARLVLIAIADRANDDGIAWPRIARLMSDANLSKRSVIYAVQSLVDIGEIEIVRPGTAQRHPVYRVVVGARSAPVTGKVCTDQVQDLHLPKSEPSEEPLEEPKPVVDPRIDPVDRDTVWQAYLAHHPAARLTTVGKNPRARIIERALRDYPADTLVAAIHGNHEDPHCNGTNDRGREYHGLELILRDADHIERYAAIHAATTEKGGRLSMDEVDKLAAEAGWPGP